MGETRPLLVDDQFRAECRRLREFAEDPKNWYLFEESDWVPGNRPEYVLESDYGYRAVFTITHAPGFRPEPFRHLSVSVPTEGKMPHHIVVFTLAHWLGFTGASVEDDVAVRPGKWGLGIDDNEGCVVVQEIYQPPTQ